jgi:hypothetical protein
MFILLVNDLVEEEIKNGIPAERVVSRYNSRKFIIIYFL